MPIRIATEQDLPHVHEIESLSFSSPWPTAILRGHLGEAGFLVYECEGAVVGYLIAGIRIPSLFERLEKRTRALMGQAVDLEERRGHIMNIAVVPRYRKQGIGRALLTEGLEYLRSLGADAAELEVRVDNDDALRLYEQFGFKIVQRIARYYKSGSDAFLMAVPFGSAPAGPHSPNISDIRPS